MPPMPHEAKGQVATCKDDGLKKQISGAANIYAEIQVNWFV